MDKKESPKKKLAKKSVDSQPPKIPGLSRRAFGVIKFILGACLLPFVYSVSLAFLNEFNRVPLLLQRDFWAGAVSFLLIFLFVWEPLVIFTSAQKVMEAVFSFVKPLVKIAPYLFPIYAVILSVIYGLLIIAVDYSRIIGHFLFLLGFLISLHIVFSAKSLRTKQDDFLKGNYIFGFSFVYILNLIILSVCLNFIFAEFSLVNFLNLTYQIAQNIFGAIIKQLFLR